MDLELTGGFSLFLELSGGPINYQIMLKHAYDDYLNLSWMCWPFGGYAGQLEVKDSETVKIEVVDTSLPGSILGCPIIT